MRTGAGFLRHGVNDLDEGALPLKDYLRRSQMMQTLGAAAAARHASENGGGGSHQASSTSTTSTHSASTSAATNNAAGGCNYLCRGGPLKQVGGFFLTFPFNEATRRSCFPSLDLRAVVSEIKRELRKCVSDVRVGRQSSAFNRDIPLLWGPPKPPPSKPGIHASAANAALGSAVSGSVGGGTAAGGASLGSLGGAGFASGAGGLLSNRG